MAVSELLSTDSCLLCPLVVVLVRERGRDELDVVMDVAAVCPGDCVSLCEWAGLVVLLSEWEGLWRFLSEWAGLGNGGLSLLLYILLF